MTHYNQGFLTNNSTVRTVHGRFPSHKQTPILASPCVRRLRARDDTIPPTTNTNIHKGQDVVAMDRLDTGSAQVRMHTHRLFVVLCPSVPD